MIKAQIASFALAASLFGAVAVDSVDAAPKTTQRGGAAGLVAAVVQVAASDVVDVRVVDSFNNLRALNNVLNNSPILSNNDIDVTVGDVSILSDFLNDNNITLEDFLNQNNVVLEDVVAIGLLETGDIIIFV